MNWRVALLLASVSFTMLASSDAQCADKKSRAAAHPVLSGPDFWKQDAQRRIKRNWLPPKEYETKVVVVVSKVFADGHVQDSRVEKSSGIERADAAALRAVLNAAPYRPLPPGTQDGCEVQFTFDYQAYGGSAQAQFR